MVAGDADHPASLERAFAGAYGAFCVTNFWEHLSAEREGRQALAMARASSKADLEHVIWSTLEDTRPGVPLTDTRLPTLHGQYNVPHFDAKGATDGVFADEAAPTTYLHAAFYWENFIAFGMGPQRDGKGTTILALPLGGVKLPGIASRTSAVARTESSDGPNADGRHFGIAGGILSGAEMARKMDHVLGRNIDFVDIPFDAYRSLGFPGAEDLGNMFQFQAILGDEFLNARTPALSRELNPALRAFDSWLDAHKEKITVQPA